jgi:hypothetical protein
MVRVIPSLMLISKLSGVRLDGKVHHWSWPDSNAKQSRFCIQPKFATSRFGPCSVSQIPARKLTAQPRARF